MGKNQEEIAKDLNITRSTFANYETEKTQPDINLLIKIADYFKVSLDELCEHNLPTQAYLPLWKLSDEQKANLYLIQQLSPNNNLRASGYLMGLLQEQQNLI